jgi:rhomboid protease GluP
MSAASEAAQHAAALLLTLGAGMAAGLLPSPRWRMPWITLAVAALTAAAFAAQLAVPHLLPLLARDPALLTDGQLWRALTPLFFQDGGVGGAVFNLTVLLLLGAIAEMQLRPGRWLAVYLGGGVLTEFLALAWQPHGAGNSIACFALAGALALPGASRPGSWWRLAPRLVALAGGLTLLLLRDIHGIGFFIGAALAGLLALRPGKPDLLSA